MPIPIGMPAWFVRNSQVTKEAAEKTQANKGNSENIRSYFTGLSGLSADAREAWESQYLNEISGLSDSDKDEVFRNTVFKDIFKDSDNKEDQDIWNNRNKMTLAERDRLVAKKALESDLDNLSDDKETPVGYDVTSLLLNPDANRESINRIFAKASGKTARESAFDFLEKESDGVAEAYRAQVANMDSTDKETLANNFDSLSREVFPNYREYIGTDKLDLSKDEIADLAANYTAWQNIGGDNFAYRMLNKTYADTIANNQSLWEKTVNTGAQFVDSGAGMIIRAAGMLGGLARVDRAFDKDESYWDGVLDNSVTRYGDRVATTQSWNAARQQYLEENGMQDKPILGTVNQQNSLLSWNTPFEVLGQYGFTAASTLLSFGGSGIVEGLTSGAGWVAKAATGAKGLNATAKGIKIARGLIRAKDIGNLLVTAGIGGVEGGMNAVQTRDKVLKGFNEDIDAAINREIDNNIVNFVRSNPEQALNLLSQAGVDIPEDVTEEDVVNTLMQDKGIREYFSKEISPKYDEYRAQAEKDARSAMMVDFIGNSIINGFINTTFQASLNAPSVQRTLRKYGLQKSPFDDLGVVIKGEKNAWNAAAKKFTKWDGVKNRFKEAWGEGIEEYTQDISGAFGEGYAKDKMSQWIDWKYGDSDGSDAFEEDVFRNFMTGLRYAGQEAFSQESIKDGLYGILSTAVGGPNANLNRGSKQRQEGESGFEYAKRRSLVSWRSAFGPLFNNNETNQVNKQRDETAKRINDFFADEEKQNLFFNLEAGTNWMRQSQLAMQSGDEKAIRDAKVGELVSAVYSLNELRGSAYYDAVVASLNARANFNPENLNNPDSTESKAADQYIADVRNRGENITKEEALQTIIDSANKTLSMIDSVEKESAEVDKLFGSSADRDTKDALVFARISANDAKSRMDTIDKELAQVTTAIERKYADEEPSGLSRRSRRIIARFGSLNEATKSIDKMVAEKESLDAQVKELKDEIKADKSTNFTSDKSSRREGKQKIREEQQVLKFLQEESKSLGRSIENAQKDIAKYRREAPKTTKVSTDKDGNEVTSEILSGREVLSASEIMGLSSADRAYMLDTKNRNKYSQAQQAEIEKVIATGNEAFNDFDSKVRDRGRLESDYTGAMRSIMKMTQDPVTFARYQQAVKEGKQRILLGKKYSYLADYDRTKSYAEFAEELTKIYEEAPAEDVAAAVRVLSRANSAYYDRYKDANNILNNIISKLPKNEAYNNLNDNDKNLFVNALEYLVSKGVDVDDFNAVVGALSNEEDFIQYLNTTNSRVKDNEKAAFTSIGEIIQNFKDVITAMRKDTAEQESNNRPVEVAPTTPEQSAPPQAPVPQPAGPGIFANTYDSPDGGRPEGSDDVEQPQVTNSPIDDFRENSGDRVAKAAEVAINTAKNTPDNIANNKARNAAVNKIESLKDNAFESEEDFADAILREANTLDINDDEGNKQIADVLRRAASAAKNQGKLQTKEVASPQSQLGGLASRKYNTSQRVSASTSPVSPNSNNISTLSIQWLKEKFPDSAFTRFLDKYKVEEFLSSPEALSGGSTIIRFINDSQLTEEVKQSMESNGSTYTKNDLPLVPVVEVKEKNDHVIVINENGEEHYYQPIGILPSTTNTWTSGANRLSKLRDLAENQEPNKLITDESGNVVSTTMVGHVIATPPKHLDENRSVQRVGANSLSASERAEMAGKSKEEARKTTAYEKMKKLFLSHLKVRRNANNIPELNYSTSNLKGDGASTGFLITRTPVHKSMDKYSDKSIIDLFREGLVAQALIANSRLKRFTSSIKEFFDGTKLNGSLFIPDRLGNLTISPAGQKVLDNTAAALGGVLSNYIVLPSNIAGGPVKYVLTPVYDGPSDAQTLRRDKDGSPVFLLSAQNDSISIPLTTITDGKVTDENVFEALHNLILDENNQPRMRSAKESFIVWQIPYKDVENMDSNSKAAANVSDIYDDGILEASIESFNYSVKSVQFNAPFKVDGTPATPAKTVANPENANAGKDETVAKTSTGAVIEPESGVQIEKGGEEQRPISPAAKIASKIIDDSKHIKLSDDGTAYVDDRTGKRYARTTSVIAADEAADERFDPNNPYSLPSTNIGTGIDELVRDFFGNTLKDPDKYPNTTKEDVEKFIEQLKNLKAQLAAGGLTVIPRDVVVTGTLEAKDSSGNTHKIDVGGTLDLLAYDAEGNFYIFDMKTFRTSIDDGKRAKYGRQLSIYKKFLEDAYGVKIKSLKIIPIKVNYPAPGRQVEYGTADTPNQLTVNGRKFNGARPALHQMIELPYREPKLQYEKLTDAERDMSREEAPTPKQSIPTNGPVIDPFTGMPMVGYENPLGTQTPAPTQSKAQAFVVSDLRWGVWTGLTNEQKVQLKDGLAKRGYTEEMWNDSDPLIGVSDAEKEHEIKCILGL